MIGVSKVISELSEIFWWLELTDQSNEVLSEMISLDSKIINRLDSKIELAQILPILMKLATFEYSKIEKNMEEKLSNGNTIGYYSNDIFRDFINSIKLLSEFEISQPKSKKPKLLSRIFNKIKFVIASNLLIVNIMKWFLVLLVMFSIPLFILLNHFNLSMDTKILIGLISVPFTLAVTVVLKRSN